MTRTSCRQARAAIVGGILGVSAMMAGAAQSAVTYTYHQTGSTPGDLPIAIEMTFGDPAGPIAGTALGGGFAGLLGFSFRTTGVEVDLQDLVDLQAQCDANPFGLQCAPGALAYDLHPEGGSFRFNNTSFDFSFSYGEDWLEGNFNTDFPGPAACRRSGACTYEGAWHPIPEPVTAGLLAAGILGLAGRGRRTRRRPARTA